LGGQSGPAGGWRDFEGGRGKVQRCEEGVERGEFGGKFGLRGDLRSGFGLGHNLLGRLVMREVFWHIQI